MLRARSRNRSVLVRAFFVALVIVGAVALDAAGKPALAQEGLLLTVQTAKRQGSRLFWSEQRDRLAFYGLPIARKRLTRS